MPSTSATIVTTTAAGVDIKKSVWDIMWDRCTCGEINGTWSKISQVYGTVNFMLRCLHSRAASCRLHRMTRADWEQDGRVWFLRLFQNDFTLLSHLYRLFSDFYKKCVQIGVSQDRPSEACTILARSGRIEIFFQFTLWENLVRFSAKLAHILNGTTVSTINGLFSDSHHIRPGSTCTKKCIAIVCIEYVHNFSCRLKIDD